MDMTRLLGQGEACYEHHCDLHINGVQRPFHVPLLLADGDFVQLWIYKTEEEPPLKSLRITQADEGRHSESDKEQQPEQGTSPRGTVPPSGSSSTGSYPPGLSLQISSWIVLIYGFSQLYGVRARRRIPVPCPGDRWCTGCPKPVSSCTSLLPQRVIWLFFCLLTLPVINALQIALPMSGRVGEAAHPGPAIWLGTSNPSGLRSKEFQYAVLPTGIWGIAETHVAEVGMHQTSTLMKRQSSICGSSRYFSSRCTRSFESP